jgi:hypothetical protein
MLGRAQLWLGRLALHLDTPANGREFVNRLAPKARIETTMVTLDAITKEHAMVEMRLGAELFEIDFLPYAAQR